MRKHSEMSDKNTVRFEMSDTLVDTLNSWAESYNDFVDTTEHRMAGFKMAMDMLLDYLGVKDRTRKRLHRFNFRLGVINLIGLVTLYGLILTGRL